MHSKSFVGTSYQVLCRCAACRATYAPTEMFSEFLATHHGGFTACLAKGHGNHGRDSNPRYLVGVSTASSTQPRRFRSVHYIFNFLPPPPPPSSPSLLLPLSVLLESKSFQAPPLAFILFFIGHRSKRQSMRKCTPIPVFLVRQLATYTASII